MKFRPLHDRVVIRRLMKESDIMGVIEGRAAAKKAA
jgi:co-chaperonin GroES (HSP10)